MRYYCLAKQNKAAASPFEWRNVEKDRKALTQSAWRMVKTRGNLSPAQTCKRCLSDNSVHVQYFHTKIWKTLYYKCLSEKIFANEQFSDLKDQSYSSIKLNLWVLNNIVRHHLHVCWIPTFVWAVTNARDSCRPCCRSPPRPEPECPGCRDSPVPGRGRTCPPASTEAASRSQPPAAANRNVKFHTKIYLTFETSMKN